jgi:hypothetical protein
MLCYCVKAFEIINMPQHRVLYIEYLVLYIEYLVLYIEYLSVFFDDFDRFKATDMYFKMNSNYTCIVGRL